MSRSKDYDSCPGYETEPNLCRCPCEGCKYNCGAHEEAPLDRDRIWFRPPGKWSGWPMGFGHDEFARKTIWFGSWLTGVIVIAYANCGEQECVIERDKMLAELGEEPW